MTATAPAPARTADRRVIAWVLLGQSTTYVALSAVVAVLLPALLAEVDPDGKERSLAVVSFVSSAVTAVTLPVVGALSDRTRSRWGRRAPWAVAGGVAGGVAVALLPSATTVVALGALWVAGQVALNLVDGAVGGAVADDVTAPRRGTGAGMLALGTGVGSATGAVVTGQLVGSPALAAALAGAVAAGGAVLFLALARRVRPATWTDRSTSGPDAGPTRAEPEPEP
ncbi:MFS transporter, partial [Cellulosimicrobium cellulans]|uniref:MFS transporter n=1 Tax=Cellulosimicrobium cellulans TaxID=1710 RepID=UPI000AAACBA8